MLAIIYITLAGIAAGAGYLTLTRRAPELVFSVFWLASSVLLGVTSFNIEVALSSSLTTVSSVPLAAFWFLMSAVALLYVADNAVSEAGVR